MTKTVCRLFLAFALWTLLAAGVSEGSEDVVNLPKTPEEAQNCVVSAADDLSKSLEKAVNEAKGAETSVEGDQNKKTLKERIAEVEKVQQLTQTLHSNAQSVLTAVQNAAADKTTTWAEVLKKAELQSINAAELVKEVGKAKEAVEKSKKDTEEEIATATTEDKPKKEKLKEALTKLAEGLKNTPEEATKFETSAKTAKKAIKKASEEASKEEQLKTDDVANVAKPNTKGQTTDQQIPPPHDPPAGTENKNTNAESGSTPTGAPTTDALKEDSSFDGSPLTVSCLATTSVLLLLARVAAVMITA